MTTKGAFPVRGKKRRTETIGVALRKRAGGSMALRNTGEACQEEIESSIRRQAVTTGKNNNGGGGGGGEKRKERGIPSTLGSPKLEKGRRGGTRLC